MDNTTSFRRLEVAPIRAWDRHTSCGRRRTNCGRFAIGRSWRSSPGRHPRIGTAVREPGLLNEFGRANGRRGGTNQPEEELISPSVASWRTRNLRSPIQCDAIGSRDTSFRHAKYKHQLRKNDKRPLHACHARPAGRDADVVWMRTELGGIVVRVRIREVGCLHGHLG
jgi:hypothetical protein